MIRRDFFILVITLFIFAFWYGGIFKYFNLFNDYSLSIGELAKINSSLESIINFDIKNYVQEIISFNDSTAGELSSLSQLLKLESLIFQYRLLSNCKTGDYYCLRFDFVTFVSSCLKNTNFNNCLTDKLSFQKQQKILSLKTTKAHLENKLSTYQKDFKSLAYLSNPFLLLGNILNPSLREKLLTPNLNFNGDTTVKTQPKFNKETINISADNEEKITYIERTFKPTFSKSRKSKDEKISSIVTTSTAFQELLATTSLGTSTESHTSTPADDQKETKKTFVGGGGSSRRDICDELKDKTYPNLMISEIQFETKDQANDEFVEIYNPSDQEIDLRCWSLEKYAAKSSTNETPTLTVLIPAAKFQARSKANHFF